MHELLYNKSGTEQRKSRTAVNIEPKIVTVLLKARQLERRNIKKKKFLATA